MLLNKRKRNPPVKFNLGLSANRPFNNWALLDKKADEIVLAKISRKIRI